MATGNYSWVPVYEAIQAGTYGDPSSKEVKDLTERLLSEAKNKDELISKGAITLGSESEQGWKAGSVDWSKLPKYGSAVDTPKNTMWAPVNSQYRVDPYSQKPVDESQGYGSVYHDENYGDLQLIQQRAPDDPIMAIGKSLVIASVLGPAASGLAGLLAPTLGISSGLGTNLLATAFKALPGIVQGGNFDSLLKGVVGTVANSTGIPGAGTAANFALSYLQKP